MPNYRAVFVGGETSTLWAPSIWEAADEFNALYGEHPETITEV